MRRRWVVAGAGAIVVLGVVLVLARAGGPESRFTAYVDAMRAAGELDTEPADSSLNAWPEVAAALDAAVEALGSERTWPGWAGNRSPPVRSAAEAFTERSRPFVARLSAALSQPDWRLSVPEAATDAESVPDSERLERCELLLRAATCFGRTADDQLEACRLRLVIAARINDDRASRELTESLWTHVAEALQSRRWDPRRARETLDGPICELATRRREALAGHLRAAWLRDVERGLAEIERARSQSFLVRLLWELPAFDGRLHYFDAVVARSKYRDEARDALRTSFLRCSDAVARYAVLPSTPSDSRAEWGHLMAVSDQLRWSCGEVAAARLARITLRVATAHGRIDSIDDERLELPRQERLDPFTDAPFAFTSNADGVRIASVGGFLRDGAHDRRSRDMVWTLSR
jgi:hypothetical protein